MAKGQARATQPTHRRTQAARSQAMRARLIETALTCLVEVGYARTTAVELCRRAGVTRGALFHHFDGLADLLATALETQFERVMQPTQEVRDVADLPAWLESFWHQFNGPNTKALLEILLAIRNDPEAKKTFQPVIDRMKDLFSPLSKPELQAELAADPALAAFYYTATEAIIGLTIGRATSENNAPLEHEAIVVDYLLREANRLEMARQENNN